MFSQQTCTFTFLAGNSLLGASGSKGPLTFPRAASTLFFFLLLFDIARLFTGIFLLSFFYCIIFPLLLFDFLTFYSFWSHFIIYASACLEGAALSSELPLLSFPLPKVESTSTLFSLDIIRGNGVEYPLSLIPPLSRPCYLFLTRSSPGVVPPPW